MRLLIAQLLVFTSPAFLHGQVDLGNHCRYGHRFHGIGDSVGCGDGYPGGDRSIEKNRIESSWFLFVAVTSGRGLYRQLPESL
jgi:hypothetical protein